MLPRLCGCHSSPIGRTRQTDCSCLAGTRPRSMTITVRLAGNSRNCCPPLLPPLSLLCAPYALIPLTPSLWESNLVFLAAGSWPIPQSYFIPKPPRPARGLEFG